MSDFGKRLKKTLAEKGMTYDDLADMAYISKASISGYITKGVEPSAEYIKIICEVLEVSADYLLGLEQKK